MLGMYSAPVNALLTKAQNKESPILIILGPFFLLHYMAQTHVIYWGILKECGLESKIEPILPGVYKVDFAK